MRNLIRLGGSLWAIGCLLGCSPNGVFGKCTACGEYKWRVLLRGFSGGFFLDFRADFCGGFRQNCRARNFITAGGPTIYSRSILYFRAFITFAFAGIRLVS